MFIKIIDPNRCDGCGSCERTCMGDVIRMSDGKAVIVYPEDCGGCLRCELGCPRQAIDVS